MASTNLPSINWPLSGPVNQILFPWTTYFTVNLGQSSNPNVEQDVLSVASYGKQLGRIGEAMIVLLRHLPADLKLDEDERRAITDLKVLLYDIAKVKQQHGAGHILLPKLE